MLFVAMGVIWGLPYLLIKVAVRDFSPAGLVFARTAIAAAILVPVAASRGQLRPVLARWRPVVVYSVVEIAVPWLLLSTAEQHLPSSLSGLLVAAVPLVGVAIATLDKGREPLGRRGLAGLGVGLVGVVVLLGFDVSSADTASVAIVAGVVVGYAIGPAVVARSLSDAPGVGVAALSLLLCAIGYAPWAIRGLPVHAPGRVMAAVVVLGVVCTAAAFVAFFALIGEVGAVRATIITYVNPAVAVVLGVAFLHEAFSPATSAGFVLILAGSVLATRRGARAQTSVADP